MVYRVYIRRSLFATSKRVPDLMVEPNGRVDSSSSDGGQRRATFLLHIFVVVVVIVFSPLDWCRDVKVKTSRHWKKRVTPKKEGGQRRKEGNRKGKRKREGFPRRYGRCTQILWVWVPAKLSWETWNKERMSGRSFSDGSIECRDAWIDSRCQHWVDLCAYLPPPTPVYLNWLIINQLIW